MMDTMNKYVSVGDIYRKCFKLTKIIVQIYTDVAIKIPSSASQMLNNISNLSGYFIR